MVVCSSHDAAVDILAALGLSGQPATRIVIDVKVCHPVKVYVELFAAHDAVERLIGTLKEHGGSWEKYDGPMPETGPAFQRGKQ